MSDSSMNEPYWVTVGGKQMGSCRLSQLQDMWQVGAITEDAYYFQEGYDHWEPISQIADLLDGPQVPESADDSSFQAPAPAWSEPTGQAAGVELGPVVSEEDRSYNYF